MDVQLIKSTGDALSQYYDAEKNARPIEISAAVFVLAMAVVLLKQHENMVQGVGAVVLAVSLLIAAWAILSALQGGPRKAVYAGLLSQDPSHYCSQEMVHLSSIEENFRRVIATDLMISVLGLGLFFLGTSQKKEFMKGFGLGLAGMFLLLAFWEHFNRRRTQRYREKVETLQRHLDFEG